MVPAVVVFSIVLGLQFVRQFLTNFIPWILTRPSHNEKQLVTSVQQQKNELSRINAQHEFAKYAKLKRVISKQEDEIQSKGLQRQKQGLKIKGLLWIIGMVFTVLCQSWIVWKYRTLPLIKLPTQWLSPLNCVLRFPTNIDGAIGLPVWLAISNTVIFQLQKMWTIRLP